MQCRNCGAEVNEWEQYCLNCGAQLKPLPQENMEEEKRRIYTKSSAPGPGPGVGANGNYNYNYGPTQNPYRAGENGYTDDSAGRFYAGTGRQPGVAYNKRGQPINNNYYGLYGVLGFIIPSVGITLFFGLKNIKNRCSNAAGLGVIIRAALWFFMFVISILGSISSVL